MQMETTMKRSLAIVAAVVAGLLSATASAAEADVGFPGPTTAHIAGSAPSGNKPESKLWFNDGTWWAVLFDDATEEHHIFRLDRPTQTWVDTGVFVDERDQSRSDTLWDGTHLYVASHIWSNGSAVGDGARLYRYSYDASTDRYSLNSGFPVYINNLRSETVVIDKDSTGKLWAAWTAFGEVQVAATQGDDRTWGAPFALPVAGASGLDSDDLASVVAFDGDSIGVMWGTQTDPAYRFAVHQDGQPDTTWGPMEPAVMGPNAADDHINLKTTTDGRVFAAVKTSETAGTSPLNLLLVRDPDTGAWSQHVFGTKNDRHTRPIVMIDESNQRVHMFATGPEKGGSIYHKSTPLNAPAFAPGKGRIFIQDAMSDDVNDASGSKQNVTRATGMPILASDDTTDRYWHNFDPLTLGADFSATNTVSTAPLTVRFTDNSTGYPTSWSWNFGDGGTSTAPEPTHTYVTPGTYTVTLTVTDATGDSKTRTRVGYITVHPSVAFPASADTYTSSAIPDRNYGTTYKILKVRQGGAVTSTTTYHTYLRFSVSGLTVPVSSAKLRLWVNDPSKVGGYVHLLEGPWSETTTTWNNQPPMSIDPIATVGAALLGGYVDVELPPMLFAGGNGTYDLGLKSSALDDAWYESRENLHPPQLVLGQPTV
jgi:PKD repeat protein